MEIDKSKYILTSEVVDMLGLSQLSNQKASSIISLIGINKKTFSNGRTFIGCCEKESVDIAIDKVKIFYDEYGVIDEFDLPQDCIKKNLKTYPMPKGYNYIFYKTRVPEKEYGNYKVVFKRKDVSELKERLKGSDELNIQSNINNYMPLKEAEKLLNCGRVTFKEIRANFDLGQVKLKGKTYLSIAKLNEFIEKRNQFYKEYITAPDISLEYLNGNTNRTIIPKLKSYKAPSYFLTIENSISTSTVGIFKRNEVEQLLKDMNYGGINITDINGDTVFETFEARLNHSSNWNGYSEESEFTYTEWFKHVRKALDKSNCNESVMSSKINNYVQCTLLLKSLLDSNSKKEIYMFTTNELNLFQRGISVLMQRTYLYYFIREIHQEISGIYGPNKLAYKISLIEKPPRTNGKNKDDDKDEDIIYNFEAYAEIFKYQLKIDYHVRKSLDEIYELGTATYASTWLYIMLHLNNAWRNGDVRDFPALNIDDLLASFEIDSLDWFKANTLSVSKARGIISRIIQWEISISKTRIDGHFFCSDNLAPALATAIIILTLHKRTQDVKDSEKLICFNTKHNQVSQGLLNSFFKDLEVNGFKFKSKKFNKTVMTFITHLANLSGDVKALEYAKYMRSHTNISSTLHYIDFNVEAVERLSELLFARGEFGYITSLLLTRINGGEVLDFEESTEQIYRVNKIFGDVTKMSTTIGFLNTIRGDRVSVAKYISERSFEECQEILTDLFARKLPSKDGGDIQCLFSKTGCQRTELKSCFDCPYHIPSIYALSSLCEVLLADIRKYSETTNVPNRYKLALSIHRKKLVLSEAVKKFGSEYVFNCLGMDKETFIEILSQIPNPLQITN
ncbi:MAG: hypothetical protein IJ086_02120 [Clostridium sp.]|nr:hypothetical protein [Clostridium sp.]